MLLRKAREELGGEEKLDSLLTKSHQIVVNKKSWYSGGPYTSEEKFLVKIQEIDAALELEYKQRHNVKKVFVIFELENEQRFCLSSLSISIIAANDSAKSLSITTSNETTDNKFRGQNALFVCEPSEPDNINWQALEVTSTQKNLRLAFSFVISGGILAASFMLTMLMKNQYSDYLFLVVAAVSYSIN
jgi:hypothetical protein